MSQDEEEGVVPPKRDLLELFSGTGSIGRSFEARGWEVTSVDIDPKANATFCCDVSSWDASPLHGRVDVIWASPPCTMYSLLRRGSTEADRASSDELVQKTLEIVDALGNNTPLFIENPWAGKLKNTVLLDYLRMHVVDYCTYGMPSRRRTAIWTNTDWIPKRRLCKHDCASSRDGRTHIARAQRGPPGPRFTQRELYRIPAELCDKIAEFCGGLPRNETLEQGPSVLTDLAQAFGEGGSSDDPPLIGDPFCSIWVV